MLINRHDNELKQSHTYLKHRAHPKHSQIRMPSPFEPHHDSEFVCLNTGINFNDIYVHKTQSVPRSKHSVSVIKTSQLMVYREIIAVCSHIHTKHTNTLCGQNAELLKVKLVVHIVTTGF